MEQKFEATDVLLAGGRTVYKYNVREKCRDCMAWHGMELALGWLALWDASHID
jgi:hypothetical protein